MYTIIKRFSSEEERAARKAKRKGIELEDSHRGLGRSLILGGGPGGAAGAYLTKSKAERDWEEGESEERIVKNAGNRGIKYGAGIGAGVGLLSGGVPGVVGGATLGALGGYLGARKNAKTRLAKTRAKMRRDDD